MPHPQAPLSPPQSPDAANRPNTGALDYFPPMPTRMNPSFAAPRVPPSPASTTAPSNTSVSHSQASTPPMNGAKNFVRELGDRKRAFWRSNSSKATVAKSNLKAPTTPGPQTTAPPARGQKPLGRDELVSMFSGAPQFSLTQPDDPISSPTGLPLIPKVTFPYTPSETQIPRLSDHVPFPQHPAFLSCSSSHQPRGLLDILDPLPSELPPMASFQGLEPGSCGWEHFILSPLGDVNNESEDDAEADGRMDIDEGGRERGMAMGGKELAGVMRSVDVGWVIERLKELGELYWVGRNDGEKMEEQDQDDGVPQSEIKTVIDPATPEEAFKSLEIDVSPGNVSIDNKDVKAGILSRYTPLELYTNLFTQLLYPPTRITTSDYHDPYSLRVQIASLTHALNMPRVWLDFSRVEWRIRLGQVLWGYNWGQNEEAVGGNNSERVWLLLQILLACELVVRLDAVAFSDLGEQDENAIGGIGGNGETKEDIFRYFREIRKKKVDWDILLARRWLENVCLVEREAAPAAATIPETQSSNSLSTQQSSSPKKKGWFSSLSSSDQASNPPTPVKYDPAARSGNPAYDALIIPRDQATQLSGLLYFAREINWPQVQVLSQTLVDNLINYVQTHHTQYGYNPPTISTNTFENTSGLITPSAETPLTTMAASSDGGPLATVAAALGNAGSYFTTSSLRPRRLRALSSRSSLRSRSSTMLLRRKESTHALMRNNTMGSGGWLSRSWFTGLVLPGESMIHLLISALLENDLYVGEKVGWEAELYGGFLLEIGSPDGEKGMWWSSFCVVAKVLGGYRGGKECMGWMGLEKGVKVLTSRSNEEDEDAPFGEDVSGWVAIHTKTPSEEGLEQDAPTVERVDKPREVARMSCILGRGWKEGVAVLGSDFEIPSLNDEDATETDIELEGLIFTRSAPESFMSDEEERHEDEYDEESRVAMYDVGVSFLVTERFQGELAVAPTERGRSASPVAANRQPQEGADVHIRRIVFHLSYDVTFITAHPCISTQGKYHPLHKSHLYTIHAPASLPGLPAPQSPIAGPGATNLETAQLARRASIMVVDATGAGAEGEVFARAWCCDRGVKAALMGRAGRGCLACAVREAGGLGVGVVVWMT
ncbi:hypothetical protein BDZ91DRAFT_444576 [Kalaharituber pfeilii]|nr:hypothetical protein BDZ91DRAFT_444576 [Kalaharituber pfeilii]